MLRGEEKKRSIDGTPGPRISNTPPLGYAVISKTCSDVISSTSVVQHEWRYESGQKFR